MEDRHWHELYLRGLMSQLDLERYEGLVAERRDLSDELEALLAAGNGWDAEMVARGRALLAVRDTFRELQADDDVPLEDPFTWPAEESVRTLDERTARRLVNLIIVRALQDGADRVSITPSADGAAVELSRDGQCRHLLTTPRALLRPLLARLKSAALLDPTTRGVEQLGRLPVRYGGRDYQVRVLVRPGGDEESASLEFRPA
jgi:type II secretory ATPase GspE/PulE/Tfp pilus assembly ATPase PilB-like protein